MNQESRKKIVIPTKVGIQTINELDPRFPQGLPISWGRRSGMTTLLFKIGNLKLVVFVVLVVFHNIIE